MTNAQKNTIENLGWKIIDRSEGAIELAQCSLAGEDFSFVAGADNFVNEVVSYADAFDVEEHVLMWLEAKRNGFGGVPDIETLVEDAKAIKKMLYSLGAALKEEG